MSKSKHTPGPWKTVKPMHGHATEYLCVQIGEDETYTTLELRPADARLISAAPELLDAGSEALEVFRDLAAELVERREYVAYFNRESGHGLKVIRRLESAIAKATGKEKA